MRIKFDFSYVHIHAAKALSLDVKEIEMALKEGEEEKFSKGEISPRVVHDGYAANAIISSVAFLEASVNEFYDKMMNAAYSWEDSDEGYNHAGIGSEILYRTLLGFQDVYSDWFSNKGLLKKYQLLLVITGREPFETGQGVFQSANSAKILREKLVHFQPDWFDSKESIGTPGSIPQNLEFNPFHESERDPESYLSYEIVDWCVNACAEFVLEFYEKMGADNIAMVSGIESLLNEE